MTQMDDIQYWADQLQENMNKIRPLTDKMLNKINSLTIEELYMLRELSVQNASFVTLLNETLAKPDPVKPLWKKILFLK